MCNRHPTTQDCRMDSQLQFGEHAETPKYLYLFRKLSFFVLFYLFECSKCGYQSDRCIFSSSISPPFNVFHRYDKWKTPNHLRCSCYHPLLAPSMLTNNNQERLISRGGNWEDTMSITCQRWKRNGLKPIATSEGQSTLYILQPKTTQDLLHPHTVIKRDIILDQFSCFHFCY